MLRRRLSMFRFHIRGRGGAWLALLGQLIAVVGLPLPAASAKDRSIPFPCQGRVCGCVRAADCWTSCCCFSAGARVAWAREHDVEPPESLVEQAEEESCEHGGACCHEKQDAAPKPKTKPAPSFRWLVTMQASRCNGQAQGDTQGPPIVPPPPAVSWQFEWSPLGLLITTNLIARSNDSTPLDPPPRLR